MAFVRHLPNLHHILAVHVYEELHLNDYYAIVYYKHRKLRHLMCTIVT